MRIALDPVVVASCVAGLLEPTDPAVFDGSCRSTAAAEQPAAAEPVAVGGVRFAAVAVVDPVVVAAAAAGSAVSRRVSQHAALPVDSLVDSLVVAELAAAPASAQPLVIAAAAAVAAEPADALVFFRPSVAVGRRVAARALKSLYLEATMLRQRMPLLFC